MAGCAATKTMAAIYIERPIEQIYNDAWIQVNRENWLEAGRQFDEVERQHPYSIWARRAILMSAYCYYAATATPSPSTRPIASSSSIPATATCPTPII